MAEKVVVYLDGEDKKELTRRAKAEGQKLSAFLRVLLRKFLSQGQGERLVPPILDAGPAIPLDQKTGREAHRAGEGV